MTNAMPASTVSTVTTGPGKDVDILYLLIGILSTILAFFGNLGTIFAFATDKKVSSKPSDMMLLNLACVDFGMAVFVIPFRLVIITALGRWPFGEIGCRLIVPLEMSLWAGGILFVILISFDRYQMLALDYSKYVKKWGNKQVKRIIAVTWLLSTLPGIFETVTWDVTMTTLPKEVRPNFNMRCSQPSSWRVFTNVICVVFVAVIPTCLVSGLGFLIIVKLHHRLQQWRKVGYQDSTAGSTASTSTAPTESQVTYVTKVGSTSLTGNQSTDENEQSKRNSSDLIRKRYIKPIVTYMSLTLCLALCTYPLSIYVLLISANMKYLDPILLKYLKWLLYSVSCWNPILYSLTNSKIRDFYRRRWNALARKFRA